MGRRKFSSGPKVSTEWGNASGERLWNHSMAFESKKEKVGKKWYVLCFIIVG